MPENSGDLWSVLSKAEPNVLLLAITAVVIVLILSLVFYLVYNKPRADKRKSNLLSSSTLPASISAAAVSAAKKKKRPKSKPSASKSKNIAPVDKMDDSPETEEEEEEEESASKTALAPAPAAAPVKAAPAPAKAAGKVKKTEEEKALDDLIAAEEKKNKDKKKKAAKATTASNGTKAKDATPVALMDAHEDDSDDDVNHGLFLNAGKKSAAFGILQSGEGWAVVETRNKPKAPTPAAAPVPAAPMKTSENEVPPLTSTAVVEDGEPGTVVEEEAASVTPAAPAAPPVPVVETITYELSVEAKKLGMLIGVKGATRIAIQKLTDTNIQMPKTEKDNTGPVIVTVSGQAAGVAKAVHAMQEMLTKGYCTMLASEDFQESDVSVHPRYIQSIIGKGGAVIRALSNHTGVKITVPADVKTPGPDGVISKVKVGLAGPKDKVALCRNLIKDITRYYHTPITHPETIHEELQIDEKYYSYIIGQKGSEIKHIQNSLKVSLHMPDKDTVNPNVVIVGEAAAVERAKAHIAKLMQKKDERDNPPPKVEEEDEEGTVAVVAEKAGTETAAAVTSSIGANWGGKSPAAAPVEGDPTWNSLSSPPPAGLTMDMSVFPPPVGTSVSTTTAAPIGLPAAPAKVGDGKPWNTLGGAKNW